MKGDQQLTALKRVKAEPLCPRGSLEDTGRQEGWSDRGKSRAKGRNCQEQRPGSSLEPSWAGPGCQAWTSLRAEAGTCGSGPGEGRAGRRGGRGLPASRSQSVPHLPVNCATPPELLPVSTAAATLLGPVNGAGPQPARPHGITRHTDRSCRLEMLSSLGFLEATLSWFLSQYRGFSFSVSADLSPSPCTYHWAAGLSPLGLWTGLPR